MSDVPNGILQERAPQAMFLRAVHGQDLNGMLAALDAGANPNGLDTDSIFGSFSDLPLLVIAAGWRVSGDLDTTDNPDVMEALLDRGADPNAGYPDRGLTALYICIRAEKAKSARTLLRHGASPNCRDDIGVTALMLACVAGDTLPGLAAHLVGAGATVNDADWEGETALMYAASTNAEAVRVLLAQGADYSMRNEDGQTALDIAIAENADEEIIRMLRDRAEPA